MADLSGLGVLFVGPTVRDIADIDALILPPAERGSVLKVLDSRPKWIAIIDGYFHQRPSIPHKEIMHALAQGIPVYGAASMGAIRAAELHKFGMVGVGQIFEEYLSGAIDGDDEVAIAHGSAENMYKPFSIPMVNIRATLGVLRNKNLVTPDEEREIISAGKGVPFWDREMECFVKNLDPRRKTTIYDMMSEFYIDQKRADADALIKILKSSHNEGIKCNFPVTSWLADWCRDNAVESHAGEVPKLFEWAFSMLYTPYLSERLLHDICSDLITSLSDDCGVGPTFSSRLEAYLKVWPDADFETAVGAALAVGASSPTSVWLKMAPRISAVALQYLRYQDDTTRSFECAQNLQCEFEWYEHLRNFWKIPIIDDVDDHSSEYLINHFCESRGLVRSDIRDEFLKYLGFSDRAEFVRAVGVLQSREVSRNGSIFALKSAHYIQQRWRDWLQFAVFEI